MKMHSSLTRAVLKFQGLKQERIADPSGTDQPNSTSISLAFDVNKKEKRSGEKLEQKSRIFKRK
jgi:hypothetical protein